MTEPQWVPLAVVMAIHEAQLAEHGGRMGVRDQGLLESALARPRQIYAYAEEPDLFQLAAGYAFGIAKNHAFADGNKRTGWVVCALFVELNDRSIIATQADVVTTMLRVAAGEISERDFAAWLRSNSE